MEYLKSIRTIKKLSEFTFKEKGSTFIGKAYPSANSDTSMEIISADKKEHYNATHVCSAFQHLGGEFKYSDDGEPNGTAGIRIYNAIQHFELNNVCITVIRYYGGTKLGVGPLGKAYYHAAYEAVSASEFEIKTNYSKFRVEYDYDFVSKIHHFLGMYNCKITDNFFTTKPAIDFLILPEQGEALIVEIQDASRGSVRPELLENNIFLPEK